MRKIFFNIYKHLLYSLMLTAMIAYVSLFIINHYRLEHYLSDISSGTFELIAEGLARHQGEKRKQWLQAVNRITGFSITTHEYSDTDGVSHQLHVDTSMSLLTLSAKRLLIQQPIRGSNEYLEARILDVNEPFARITALLVLNDLGRFSAEQRKQRLVQLQQKFGYPITKMTRQQLQLSSTQLRRINQGDVFVELKHSASEINMTVFAPYGNTNDVLVLGPIDIFEWYPPELIGSLIVFVLILVAIFGYYLVNPLEQRLDILVAQVDRIGVDFDKPSITLGGEDGLGHLALRMNQMAERIHVLLENQREILHAVSHELRTPVARLDFRLELLKDSLQDQDKRQRIDGMQDDLSELNELVEELLHFARLSSTQNVYEPQWIDLAHLVYQLKEKLCINTDIKVLLNLQLTRIWADEQAMTRVLQNLLTNAIKYAKTRISIRAWQRDGISIIKVDDDGEGIDEEDFSMVFEPFARVDASRSKDSGGFGLGLAICRKLVQANYGRIYLEQSELGGASFVIELPEPQ